jgi:hypothetical protein
MLQRTSFFLATSHWARLCHATAATQQYLLASLSNDARREDASIKTKIHVLKCTKAPLSSPISQAVALMLSREQIPLQQLHTSMDLLSQQLLDDMPAYSSTQLAAFTEACRQELILQSLNFRQIVACLSLASKLTSPSISSTWGSSSLQYSFLHLLSCETVLQLDVTIAAISIADK